MNEPQPGETWADVDDPCNRRVVTAVFDSPNGERVVVFRKQNVLGGKGKTEWCKPIRWFLANCDRSTPLPEPPPRPRRKLRRDAFALNLDETDAAWTVPLVGALVSGGLEADAENELERCRKSRKSAHQSGRYNKHHYHRVRRGNRHGSKMAVDFDDVTMDTPLAIDYVVEFERGPRVPRTPGWWDNLVRALEEDR